MNTIVRAHAFAALLAAGSCSNAPAHQESAPSSDGVWRGSLTVECEDDASRLDGMRHLTGNLTIRTAGISRIALRDVEEIDGSLLIEDSDALEIVELPKLSRIGGDLTIGDNADLKNLNGLAALGQVGGNLFFVANDALQNVNGLSALHRLDGFLHIYGNPALTSLAGFNGLSRVGGSIHIWDNDALETFDGLHNVEEIGGELCFANDDSLRDVSALSRITHVKGHLYVFLDHELESLLGLHNIEQVDGTVFIGFKQGKQTFGALALRNLDGLASLKRIGKHLLIAYNEVLDDLGGLEQLRELGGSLIIFENKALPACAAQALEAQLRERGWSGRALVDGNVPDDCSPPSRPGSAAVPPPTSVIDKILPLFERS